MLETVIRPTRYYGCPDFFLIFSTAQELDRKFDSGAEDVLEHFDFSAEL